MSLEDTAPSPEDNFEMGGKIVTLKPFGAPNHEDQWNIVQQPEASPVEKQPGHGLSVINFTNRSISLFSQFRDGKLLIGIVKQDQVVG